jgi:cold shock CspA family protein/ribosome-associated translation inhibitor RaiA
MEPSATVEERVRERAERLDRFHEHIMSCRVVIESPHRHKHQGALFHVRIDLTVPGHEIVVNREPSQHHAHEDVYVAIRDAFDAAQRQVEAWNRKRKGFVKTHTGPEIARVSKIAPAEGYGFITASDGREIYFHRHRVVDGDFQRLKVGSAVRFAEEQGDKGPQASTVHVIG